MCKTFNIINAFITKMLFHFKVRKWGTWKKDISQANVAHKDITIPCIKIVHAKTQSIKTGWWWKMPGWLNHAWWQNWMDGFVCLIWCRRTAWMDKTQWRWLTDDITKPSSPFISQARPSFNEKSSCSRKLDALLYPRTPLIIPPCWEMLYMHLCSSNI